MVLSNWYHGSQFASFHSVEKADGISPKLSMINSFSLNHIKSLSSFVVVRNLMISNVPNIYC